MGTAELTISTSSEVRRTQFNAGIAFPNPYELSLPEGFAGFVFASKNLNPREDLPLSDLTIEFVFTSDGPPTSAFITAPDNDPFFLFYAVV